MAPVEDNLWDSYEDYNSRNSHFFFPMCNSINIFLILYGCKSGLIKALLSNFSRTINNIAPLLLFQLIYKGLWNYKFGILMKEMSHQLRKGIIKKSILAVSMNCIISNVFIIKLIFKLPMLTLLG